MCEDIPNWFNTIYFAVVIMLFQFGWPIVQVSHLSIIPEMSRTQKDRAQLSSVRYSASVVANVIVFIVTLIVLRTNRANKDSKIGPEDAYRFRVSSLFSHSVYEIGKFIVNFFICRIFRLF